MQLMVDDRMVRTHSHVAVTFLFQITDMSATEMNGDVIFTLTNNNRVVV